MRPLLRWMFWAFIASIFVTWLVAGFSAWEGGPAIGSAQFFERAPLLVLINFVVLGACAILAFALDAATDKWRWAQQWFTATALAYLPVLIAMAIWPGWLDDNQVLRWPMFLALLGVGGVWALLDRAWQKRDRPPQ